MNDLVREIRSSLRSLGRNPAFSFLAAATVALGIGVGTAIFGIVHSILWRPLPYPNAARLTLLHETSAAHDLSLSYPDYLDWKSENRVFSRLTAFTSASPVLTGQGDAERLSALRVAFDFLPVFGSAPLVGRDFRSSDDRRGAPPVVLLSYDFWQRRFGGDPGRVGRPLLIDGAPAEVIGILPAGFHLYDGRRPDALLPLEPWVMDPRNDASARSNHPGLRAVGLLREGLSVSRATDDLNLISRRLAARYPESNAGHGAAATPLLAAVVDEGRPALLLLFAASGLVLLIVCANVASLLLTRATARGREMAIRVAIGARRRDLVRTLLIESSLLALIGGGMGVALAAGIVRVLVFLAPSALPRLSEASVDFPAVLFAVALVAGTSIASGLLPAWEASRSGGFSLGFPGVAVSPGRRGRRNRHALVSAEIALALILLSAAGLLVRSVRNLLAEPAGIDATGVVTARISLPDIGYDEPLRQTRFFEDVEEELRAAPGISAVGIVNPMPFSGWGWQFDFFIAGRALPKNGEFPNVDGADVDPGFFAALRLPLRRGRLLSSTDGPGAPKVAVVNEAMARRYWPGGNAVGQRFSPDVPPSKNGVAWVTVVGVVGDAHQDDLDHPVRPQAFVPFAQWPQRSMSLLVKSDRPAGDVLRTIRSVLRRRDPNLAVSDFAPLGDLVRATTASRRFTLGLLGTFAALALILAAIGVYGVLSLVSERRTREIGLRLALGATRGDVVALVVREARGPALAGIGGGLAGSIALSGAIRGLLFGVAPFDPATFAAVCGVVVLVGLAAAWLPARRAARVDPMTALRQE